MRGGGVRIDFIYITMTDFIDQFREEGSCFGEIFYFLDFFPSFFMGEVPPFSLCTYANDDRKYNEL